MIDRPAGKMFTNGWTQERSISQARKKTDQKYKSYTPIGMPTMGHMGRKADPSLAVRYP